MKNFLKSALLIMGLFFIATTSYAQKTKTYKPTKGDQYVYVLVRYNTGGKCFPGLSNRKDKASLVLNWGSAYKDKKIKLKPKKIGGGSVTSQGVVLKFKNYGNDFPLTVTAYDACELRIGSSDPKERQYEYKSY